jgi:hypothetical protein
VSISCCYMKTLAFVSPKAFVNLFLSLFFFRMLRTFGNLQASLNSSLVAILSLLRTRSKHGPTSLKGTVSFVTVASEISLVSIWRTSIGEVSLLQVKTSTRFNSTMFTSLNSVILKKSTNKFLILLCLSETSNTSPWKSKIGFSSLVKSADAKSEVLL